MNKWASLVFYPLARTSWLEMDPPLPSAAVALILSFLASIVWEEVPVSSLPRAMALSNTFREAYRTLGAASIQLASVTPMFSSIISERRNPGVSATTVTPRRLSSIAMA